MFKSIMWGSKEFDNKITSVIPEPAGKEDKRYIRHIDVNKLELIEVSESDPAMIEIMLNSGSYRYATKSEVDHWKFVKECGLFK